MLQQIKTRNLKVIWEIPRLHPHLIHPSFDRPHSPPQTASGSNHPFYHYHSTLCGQTDAQTDRPTDGLGQKPIPIPAYALSDIATWLTATGPPKVIWKQCVVATATSEMHSPATCASYTMRNVTEPLRNVTEALWNVPGRYGALLMHYRSVTERYWSVTELLRSVAGRYGCVTERFRAVT